MTEEFDRATSQLSRLLSIMAKLRDPKDGCPWDVQQTFETIAPYTIEEAYEVANAITRGNMGDLCDELGDLMFQAVFHARMAQEQGSFEFADVLSSINDKMVRRHPHVFADAKERNADEQTASWEDQKAAERSAKGVDGLLSDVPVNLPGLTRAVKLQKRAARVGFDWTDAKQVLAKVAEEAGELTDAVNTKDKDQIEDEFGDLLFVLSNLSRHLKVDPEAAIRRANAKFTTRFSHIEKTVRDQGSSLDETSVDEMEALWNEAKAAERKPPV